MFVIVNKKDEAFVICDMGGCSYYCEGNKITGDLDSWTLTFKKKVDAEETLKYLKELWNKPGHSEEEQGVSIYGDKWSAENLITEEPIKVVEVK